MVHRHLLSRQTFPPKILNVKQIRAFFFGKMRIWISYQCHVSFQGLLFTTIYRLRGHPKPSRHLGATTPGRRSTTPSVCLANRWIEWIEDLPRKIRATPRYRTPQTIPRSPTMKGIPKNGLLVEVAWGVFQRCVETTLEICNFGVWNIIESCVPWSKVARASSNPEKKEILIKRISNFKIPLWRKLLWDSSSGLWHNPPHNWVGCHPLYVP